MSKLVIYYYDDYTYLGEADGKYYFIEENTEEFFIPKNTKIEEKYDVDFGSYGELEIIRDKISSEGLIIKFAEEPKELEEKFIKVKIDSLDVNDFNMQSWKLVGGLINKEILFKNKLAYNKAILKEITKNNNHNEYEKYVKLIRDSIIYYDYDFLERIVNINPETKRSSKKFSKYYIQILYEDYLHKELYNKALKILEEKEKRTKDYYIKYKTLCDEFIEKYFNKNNLNINPRYIVDFVRSDRCPLSREEKKEWRLFAFRMKYGKALTNEVLNYYYENIMMEEIQKEFYEIYSVIEEDVLCRNLKLKSRFLYFILKYKFEEYLNSMGLYIIFKGIYENLMKSYSNDDRIFSYEEYSLLVIIIYTLLNNDDIHQYDPKMRIKLTEKYIKCKECKFAEPYIVLKQIFEDKFKIVYSDFDIKKQMIKDTILKELDKIIPSTLDDFIRKMEMLGFNMADLKTILSFKLKEI